MVQRLYQTEKAPTVVVVSLGAGCALIVINDLVLGGDGLLGRILLFGKDFLHWTIKRCAEGNVLAQIVNVLGHCTTNRVLRAPLISRAFVDKKAESKRSKGKQAGGGAPDAGRLLAK